MQRTSPPSGTQWQISAGGQEAVVVEVGGGVRAYRADGQEILDGYGEQELCPGGAGQVLAPWPNRIRDGKYSHAGHPYQLPLSEPEHHNAMHGLVRWLPWKPVSVAADRIELETVLPAQTGYPWTLHLTTAWSIGADGLRAEHTATNLSTEDCPFGLGVHPYLTLGVPVEELYLTVPARSRLLVDRRKLPIGAAKVAGGEYDFAEARRIGPMLLDDAFGDVPVGGNAVTLSTQDNARSVTVWADDSFHWWQVYTGDTLTPPRTRRSVAVEPMTCPADAFHSGRDLVCLSSGDSWRGSWGITPKAGG